MTVLDYKVWGTILVCSLVIVVQVISFQLKVTPFVNQVLMCSAIGIAVLYELRYWQIRARTLREGAKWLMNDGEDGDDPSFWQDQLPDPPMGRVMTEARYDGKHFDPGPPPAPTNPGPTHGSTTNQEQTPGQGSNQTGPLPADDLEAALETVAKEEPGDPSP